MTDFDTSTHLVCPSCLGEYQDRLYCTECYGKGEILTKTAQHIQNAESLLKENCERSFVNDTISGLLDVINDSHIQVKSLELSEEYKL